MASTSHSKPKHWPKKKLPCINIRFDWPWLFSFSINPIYLLKFYSLKSQQQSKVGSPPGGNAAVNNPFLSSPTNSGNIVDLFSAPAPPQNSKASDDLLQLGNPFADMFGPSVPTQPPMTCKLYSVFFTLCDKICNFFFFWLFSACVTGMEWGVLTYLVFDFIAAVPPASNAFVSDSNFSSVFGVTEPAGMCARSVHPFVYINQTCGTYSFPYSFFLLNISTFFFSFDFLDVL